MNGAAATLDRAQKLHDTPFRQTVGPGELDIPAVRGLGAGGVKMLPIPENYYDDLEARTDLSAEQLAVLRANAILYDRDESGEYLQAYTQSFKELFFFEIVERRGYTGFGAVNVPIRLAAQARLTPAPALPGLSP